MRRLLRAGFASQLRRNTLAGGISAIVGAAIAAISYPIYLHYLGYEQYGLWLSVGIVLSFAQFGNLGLAPAVARSVAGYLVLEEFDSIKATVSSALVALSAVGVLGVFAVLFGGKYVIGAMHLSAPLTAQARSLLPFVAVLSLYAIQIDTVNAVLVGLGRLDLSVASQVASRLLALTASTVMLAAGFGVVSLPIAFLIGYVFLHFTSLALARRVTGHNCLSVRAFNYPELRKLATFGSGMLSCTIMSFLLGPLNKFTLTRFSGPGSVPVYDLAFTMSLQLRGFLEAGFRSLMPEVSCIAALNPPDIAKRLISLNRRSMKLIAIAGLPVYLLLFVWTEPILRIWLQARFQPMIVSTLRVLLVASFLNLCAVPAYYMLIGLGKVRHVVICWVMQCGFNVAILAAYVMFTGSVTPTGTAIATAAGIVAGVIYVLAAITRIIVTKRHDMGITNISLAS